MCPSHVEAAATRRQHDDPLQGPQTNAHAPDKQLARASWHEAQLHHLPLPRFQCHGTHDGHLHRLPGRRPRRRVTIGGRDIRGAILLGRVVEDEAQPRDLERQVQRVGHVDTHADGLAGHADWADGVDRVAIEELGSRRRRPAGTAGQAGQDMQAPQRQGAVAVVAGVRP